MPEELTTEQVAAAAGIHRSYVHRWVARHGIGRTVRKAGSIRRYYYPAAAVHAAVAASKPSGPVVAALRQLRFIANPLNWRY